MIFDSRTLIRAGLALTLLGVAVSALPSEAGRSKSKARDLMISRTLPDVTREDLAYQPKGFAEGSPAVILVDAQQEEWDANFGVHRTRVFQRIKILEESAIEEWGDARFVFYGGSRSFVESVKARTTLPDGSEIDASEGVFETESEYGAMIVNVAFPQVQAGAILDVQISVSDEDFFDFRIAPREIQHELPVLESRYIFTPPVGLSFRPLLPGIPESEWKPKRVGVLGGGHANIWRFRNVEPLPDLPYMPHRFEVSKKILIVATSFSVGGSAIELYDDWESWSEREYEAWDAWTDKNDRDFRRFAEEVAKSAGGRGADTWAKVLAIHEALKERLNVAFVSDGVINGSPDEALESGKVTSAEYNVLAWYALREMDIDTTLVALRRRGEGRLYRQVPLPILFNDVILRFDDEPPTYWSPAAGLLPGELPMECQGIVVAPITKKGKMGLEEIPDFFGKANAVHRSTAGHVDDEGFLEAETTFEFRRLAAQRWRDRFEALSPEERKRVMFDYLERYLDNVEIGELGIGESEDPQSFVVVVSWAIEDFATFAGDRMLVPSTLFGETSPESWAPTTRDYLVDLGMPFHTVDRTELTLPEGVALIEPPRGYAAKLGKIGVFTGGHVKRPGKIVSTREFYMDHTLFPETAYPQLRQVFREIAGFDDRPVVVTLGDAM